MTAPEPDDEQLMRAYVGGDHAAFRVLFERYGPILLRMTRRHLRSDDEARDVVQQTFFQLHKARHDFRQDSPLRPWVMTIAMNLVRESWRRKKRRRFSPLDDERPAPMPELGPVEAKQRAARLREAMASLPESQRLVVELHWFQEHPYAQVAALLGTSEGAVRVRAHRAYRKLQRLLEDDLRC